MDKNNNLTQTNNPSINNNKTTSTMNSDLEKITNELNNLKGAELEKRLFYYTKSFNNYNEESPLINAIFQKVEKLIISGFLFVSFFASNIVTIICIL